MFVCDISEYGTLRVAGTNAPQFIATMYSGPLDRCEKIGEMSDGLLLNSLGEIVDAVQVFKTGDNEYLLLTSPENTEEANEWLSAHADLTDGDEKVFPDLTVSDHSDVMAALMLYGDGAGRVYSELVEACRGKIAIMHYAYESACYGVADMPAFLVLAPMNAASAIGDFLMEDPEVEIVDFDKYRMILEEQGHFEPMLHGAEYVKPSDVGMEGLLRDGGGFVGAKALGL